MTVVTALLLTPPRGSNHSPYRFTERCVALLLAIWPPHESERRFRRGYCWDTDAGDGYRAEFDAMDAAGWHATGPRLACFDDFEPLGCHRISHALTPAGALVRRAVCPDPDGRAPDAAARHYAWCLHHEHGDGSRYPDRNPLELLLRNAATGGLAFRADLMDYAAAIGEARCEGNRRGRA